MSIEPKIGPHNQKDEIQYQLLQKAQPSIAFIKFYFYDNKTASIKICQGSGFLNSSLTVVTAFHNIFIYPDKIMCSHCTIYLRDPNKNNKQITIKSRPSSEWLSNSTLDMAIISLQQQVNHFKVELQYGDTADFQNEPFSIQLYVAGYSNQLNKNQNINNKKKMPEMNRIISTFNRLHQNIISYKGDTYKGHSGSPIMYVQKESFQSKIKIIGMHISKNQLQGICRGVLFNQYTINIIQCWMKKLQPQKTKIQKQLSMMQSCFIKIIESVKLSLTNKKYQQSQNQSIDFKNDSRQKYKLQTYKKQLHQDSKVAQKQGILKKHEQLMDLLLYNQPQEQIYQKIGDISIILEEYQMADMFFDKSIVQMKEKGNDPFPKIQRLNKKKYQVKQKIEQSISSRNKRQLHMIQKKLKKKSAENSQPFQGQSSKQLPSMYSNKSILPASLIEDPTISSGQSEILISSFSQSIQSNKKTFFRVVQGQSDSPTTSSITSIKINQNQPCSVAQAKDSQNRDLIGIRGKKLNEVKYSNRSKYPFNCIGRITFRQSKESIFGTGFLISPLLVLTAANNFVNYHQTGIQQLCPCALTLPGAVNQRQAWKTVKIVDYRICRQFLDCKETIFDLYSNKNHISQAVWKRQLSLLTQKQLKHDVALLLLEQPIIRSQYFQLLSDPNPFGNLAVYGYSLKDNQFDQIYQKICIYIPADTQLEGRLFYHIDTSAGLSGSPILIISEDSVKLVGINSCYSEHHKSNVGIYINDKIIQIIQCWASEMHCKLLINDPKNTINDIQKQLENKYYQNQKLKKHLQVIYDQNQKNQQALNTLRESYSNLCSQIDKSKQQQLELNKIQKLKFCSQIDILKQHVKKITQEKQQLYSYASQLRQSCHTWEQKNQILVSQISKINQQLQKNKMEKQKLLKDKQFQNSIISQMENQIQSLQRAIRQMQKKGQLIKSVSKTQKQKPLEIQLSMKDSLINLKPQQICIQIVGNGYAQIIKNLILFNMKKHVTSLTIKNTVAINLRSVFDRIYKTQQYLKVVCIYHFILVQIMYQKDGTFSVIKKQSQINSAYFIKNSGISEHMIETQAVIFLISKDPIPDILKEFEKLRNLKLHFKYKSNQKGTAYTKLGYSINQQTFQIKCFCRISKLEFIQISKSNKAMSNCMLMKLDQGYKIPDSNQSIIQNI